VFQDNEEKKQMIQQLEYRLTAQELAALRLCEEKQRLILNEGDHFRIA
jgi:hypothetical protein